MQAAGMLRGTGAMRGVHVLLLGTLSLAFICDNTCAHPLQQLPNIPGWIPVYIRNGDQPLDEINPELARAFHEKQSLESIALRGTEHADDNLQGNLEHRRSSYGADDDGGDLNAGARRKGTIFLIGVRQSSNDGGRKDNDGVVPKIALPFEVIEREGTIESINAADDQDREKTEDAWIEELDAKMVNERKPIGISKEAIIKTSGLPVNVKELERLATRVEKEETRPNDLYDETIGADSPVSSSRRSGTKKLFGVSAKELKNIETIMKDMESEGSRERTRPIEDPKEFRSSRSKSGETLRPGRDPKESRPNDDSTDFMESEE